ncbi:MAG: adenosine kinase [Magnetococcales bacterium]|nr:adenosine kinase [Magnetococcales bacterium]
MSKQYDVYGVGHALVDTVLEVEDSFLERFEIPKGTMSLVDGARQQELLSHLPAEKALQACGGSAANSMIAVAQFGGRAFHVGQVAEDDTGEVFIRDMRANGVDHRLDMHYAKGRTGRCLVLVTPDAERTMLTNLGVSEQVGTQNLRPTELNLADYLYVEGYLVSSPSALGLAVQAVAEGRKAGVKTSLTFSDIHMVRHVREGMESIIGPGLDLIFCNENEALEYAETDDLSEAKRKLRTRCQAYAITLGPRGASLFDGDKEIEIPGRIVDAKDTNGAGDLFAGVFLRELARGAGFEKAGRLAALAILLPTQRTKLLKSIVSLKNLFKRHSSEFLTNGGVRRYDE